MAKHFFNDVEAAKEAVQSLSTQIDSAAEACIVAGEWPRLKPLPTAKYDLPNCSILLHWRAEKSCWVLRRTSKITGGVVEIEDPSRVNILSRLVNMWAETTQENEETEALNREFEGADEETRAFISFLSEHRQGIQFSDIEDHLDIAHALRLKELLLTGLAESKRPLTANNLCLVHDGLLDNNDEYWGLKLAADAEKKRRADEEIAEAAEAALDASRQTRVEAETPFSKLLTEEQREAKKLRDAQLSFDRSLSFKELRRKVGTLKRPEEMNAFERRAYEKAKR
jgi:hypothetical protein